MSSQSIANFYIPSEAAMPSYLFIPDVFPGGRHESFDVVRSRHSRKRSSDTENVHSDRHTSSTSAKKDRRRTIDCGQPRPSFTPRDGATQRIARILPQRTITPRSTAGARSIWFQPENEHPDFGVPLAGILVDNGVESLMVAPEERVFQGFGRGLDEIQFSILWPGYGHISWIASIPTNFREKVGHRCRPITRRLLATAVAQHFQAFMTNHSYLRFPHPDPNWKIMNVRENGIRFEDLRLTRLFSYKDETGKFSSWQAEILVISDPSAYTN